MNSRMRLCPSSCLKREGHILDFCEDRIPAGYRSRFILYGEIGYFVSFGSYINSTLSIGYWIQLITIFFSNRPTNSLGCISKALANRTRVEREGCFRPRSRSEMYVRCRSLRSASSACEIFFPSRTSSIVLPKACINAFLFSEFIRRIWMNRQKRTTVYSIH